MLEYTPEGWFFMQKLFDVSCNYHSDGGRGTGIFKGACILEEDGWFEGIVKDSTEIYDGDCFVFGAHIPHYLENLHDAGRCHRSGC